MLGPLEAEVMAVLWRAGRPLPVREVAAAASPAGEGPASLEARVTQLEAGRPPRQRPAVTRLLASAGTLSLLAPASLCCAALSQFLPGGLL